MAEHTPGPWLANTGSDGWFEIWSDPVDDKAAKDAFVICARSPIEHRAEASLANGRLIVAAPDMLAALRNVNKLISEAAMVGFNWKDGDWADRLFASQQVTSAAIRKATKV